MHLWKWHYLKGNNSGIWDRRRGSQKPVEKNHSTIKSEHVSNFSLSAWRNNPTDGGHTLRTHQLRAPTNTSESVQNFIRLLTQTCAQSFSRVQLFCDPPWTLARQALLSIGFSTQEYCSGLPCPPPGDLPDPGTDLHLPCLLHCKHTREVNSTSDRGPLPEALKPAE